MSLLPGWGGVGVGREGSILGGGWWVKAEGEAVANEGREFSFRWFAIVFDFVSFLKKKKDSIGQLPFSTSLFVTRTIVEKMFFSIL